MHARNLPLHIVPLSVPSRSPLMLIRPLEDMMKVCRDEIFSRDVKMNVALCAMVWQGRSEETYPSSGSSRQVEGTLTPKAFF